MDDVKSRSEHKVIIAIIFLLVLSRSFQYINLYRNSTRRQLNSPVNSSYFHAQNHVTLWIPYDPRKCSGSFVHESTTSGSAPSISFVVREAAVDKRHVSIQEARRKYKQSPCFRLQVLFSVIPNPQIGMFTEILSIANQVAQADIRFPNKSVVPYFDLHFDHFLEDRRYQRNCDIYKTCRVREWQAILTLIPRSNQEPMEFSEQIEKTAQENAYVSLKLPVVLRANNSAEIVEVTVGLNCFARLTQEGSIPNMKLKKSTFFALWMDFHVEDQDMRSFTRKMMKGERIGLKERDVSSKQLNISECYGGGGKAIAHCSNTIGLLAHYALIVEKNSSLSDFSQKPSRKRRNMYRFRTSPFETEIYTWHARKPTRQGNCMFDKTFKNQENQCSIKPRSSVKCKAAIKLSSRKTGGIHTNSSTKSSSNSSLA